MKIVAKPGKTDSLMDIEGIRIGQAEDEEVWTGVTVIVPDEPAAMGVDVRGGGPGTRDTDALDPTCLVEKFHGLVLAGGSVFGLAAADGAVNALASRGIGLPLGPKVVPVVPAAILFDLLNGGNKEWGDEPPYRRLGKEAVRDLSYEMKQGRVGAGYGARAGARPGGLGSASLVMDDGTAVAAVVAVNSFGFVTKRDRPNYGVVELSRLGLVGTNTTIGAVVTNATLDKAGCQRLAIMAQDGLARAIRPIHTPFDGDTVFAMATGEKPLERELSTSLAILGTLAADCMARAIEKAVGK